MGTLAEPFRIHPEAAVLALAEPGGSVVGLVAREAVERAIEAGEARLPARRLMTPAPPTVGADSTVREALARLLTHPDRPEMFVAVRDGAYAGVGSVRVLTQALLAHIPAAGPDDLRAVIEAAEGEMRGHIHGLLAMADQLARQPLSPDALAQARSIRATGESLLRLADDARDMLEAREGRLQLKPRPEPLRVLMDEVHERWTGRAREAGVAVLVSYDGDPDLAVVVDAERLTQVFDLLIDQALRHTRHGSVEAALRARLAGDQVLLEGRVRDTAGRDPAPGEWAPNLSQTLARSIVGAMRGVLRTHSNAGQGHTMVFELTAEPAGEPEAKGEERSLAGAPHVLVVDDNATNRMVAEALCEMFDCTSETAEDGVQAVERVRTGRFDLILMDIKMPRMDGIAATRAIRGLEGPSALTPVVALTANVDPEDARSYLQAGMCCVVEKPIKPDRLLQAINIALSTQGAAADKDSGAAAA